MNRRNKHKIKRMDKPDDTLVKRQSSYAGDVMHEYHGFPGHYLGPCMNEYPNALGGVPRTDSTYYINYHGRRGIMNWEEESGKVNIKTLDKLNNYRINLEYFSKTNVISAITTPTPIENELEYDSSPTLPFKPLIISYQDMDGNKILSTIKSKIKDKEVLSKVESMNLVMIPKMFNSNQDIVLEEVCKLLKELKIDDESFKLELIFEIKCVIHKYAKTLADIERLEGVIGLQEAITAKQFQDQKLIHQGEFNLALKLKKEIGIEKILEITDFTREELESEKLNR